MSKAEKSTESDSDSDEEVFEESKDIIKEGYIEVKDPKKKNKWKLNWIILVKGSLYFYKHFEKPDPHASIKNLKEGVFEKDADTSKPFTIGIKIGTDNRCIAAVNAQDQTAWLDALRTSATFIGSPAPERKAIPKGKRTTGTLFKAKKAIAGSAMGTSLIVKLFGEETAHLLKTLKKIVAKHRNKEKAKEVHQGLIKLVVKVAFQIQKKNITMENFSEVDPPLRQAFELLSKYYNARLRRFSKRDGEKECFSQVEILAKEAEAGLTKMLSPYLTPKNLAHLHVVFDTLGNADFLRRVWTDPDLPEELDEIDDQLASYTQIHF